MKNKSLLEICCDEHYSCSDECPVFEANGGIPWTHDLSVCECFKDGEKMAAFLKEV
jgi:hypothetical protein